MGEDGKKYTILYVDDEESNLRIFKTAFRREYDVITAISPTDGLRMLKENTVHVLITDQKMPEMTGAELLAKTIDDYPNLIRMILTGFADIESIVSAINKGGIQGYITKPWDRGEVQARLETALQSYSLKQDNESLVEQLQKYNEELEVKVSERTQELEMTLLKLKDSVRYAERIQKAMIPAPDSLKYYYPESFIIFKPKDIVSGDFYWLTEKHGKIIIALADCTGHGIPGAFMSMLGSSLLTSIVHDRDVHSPEQVLQLMNLGVEQQLKQEISQNSDGMEVAIISIDKEAELLYFSGAHQHLYYISEGVLNIIKGNIGAIGGNSLHKEVIEFSLHTLPLDTISSVYLFSDGFPDQFGGGQDKKYSSGKLKRKIEEISSLALQEQKNILDKEFTEWMGNSLQTDDVSMIGIKIS